MIDSCQTPSTIDLTDQNYIKIMFFEFEYMKIIYGNFAVCYQLKQLKKQPEKNSVS